MPGSDRHIRDGVIVGGILTIVAAYFIYQQYRSIRLAAIGAGAAFFLIVIGSVLPDTDVKSSKPYRGVVKAGTAMAAVAVIYLAAENWQLYLATLRDRIGGLLPSGVPLPAIALILIGLTIPLLNRAVATGVDKATGSHRTRTHNPLILLGTAVSATGVLWILIERMTLFGFEIRPLLAVGVPATLFIGALVHIGRDKFS